MKIAKLVLITCLFGWLALRPIIASDFGLTRQLIEDGLILDLADDLLSTRGVFETEPSQLVPKKSPIYTVPGFDGMYGPSEPGIIVGNIDIGRGGTTSRNDVLGIGGRMVQENMYHTLIDTSSFKARFPQVGAIVFQKETLSDLSGACTGTLVGPTTVMTAAHCFLRKKCAENDTNPRCESNGWEDPLDQKHWKVFFPYVGLISVSERVKIHPNFNPDSGMTGQSASDLALLELANQPVGIEPLSLNLNKKIVSPNNHKVTLIGYGYRDTGKSNFGVRRYGPNIPLNKCDFSGSVKPPTDSLCYKQKRDQSVACNGDSGGPAIEFRSGKPILIGNIVGGEGLPGRSGYYCSSSTQNWLVDLEKNAEWLRKNIENSPNNDGQTMFLGWKTLIAEGAVTKTRLGDSSKSFTLKIATGVKRLMVSLSGELEVVTYNCRAENKSPQVDFDLLVSHPRVALQARHLINPPILLFARNLFSNNFESFSIDNPQEGDWTITVSQSSSCVGRYNLHVATY